MLRSQSRSIPCRAQAHAVSRQTETSGEEAKEILGDEFSGVWFTPSVAPFTTMELLMNISKQNKIQVVDAGSNQASTFSFFHVATTHF